LYYILLQIVSTMRIWPYMSQRRILLLLISFCVLHSSQRYCPSLVNAVEIETKHVVEDNNNDNSNNTTTTTFSLRGPSLPEIPATQPIAAGNILRKAWLRGLNGGISGLVAGCIQVITLMWLRTVINYQCRYGTTFRRKFVLWCCATSTICTVFDGNTTTKREFE